MMTPGVYNLNLSGGGGGGSGTITAGTTNQIPKYTAATTVGNSLLADNGTTLTYTGSGGLSVPAAIATASTTFALLNTTATTVNAFGAATTLNIGASATCILNFGGGTTASEFRFLEPSGSGTNYTAFKAVAQSANITYSLPASVGAAGTVLTDAAGNGVLSWAAAAGTVTVVSAGSLTSTAIVTGGGTTTLQTPSATSTLDSSGNMSLAGTITVGNAATTAGAIALTQGTTQSTGTTNVTIQAPTSVTSYIITVPGTVGATGLLQWTVSGSVATLSSVTTLPSNITVDGTNLVGFLGIPQNSKSAAYTTVAADAGKHILHPTADNNARTFTIDSNANVPYVIGTAITFINQINTVTIAITSDTMTLYAGSGTGTTGSRTLAAGGTATAVKVASTAWIITGIGLT
jgi:hypothetical protein